MSSWIEKLKSHFSKTAKPVAHVVDEQSTERPVERYWKSVSDDEWRQVLVRSVDEPVIEGVSFPRFPPPDLQARFVGSANGPALAEASVFYSLFKTKSQDLGQPIGPASTFLDFGCGWGRFLRFFWR